jgi:PEP-CTERM motif
VFTKQTASVLIVLALTVAWGRADGALQLTVSSSAGSLSFADGGAGDTSSTAGILSVSYTLGYWVFSSTVVASSPVIGSPTQALIDLASLNISSYASGTLEITATDTGYTLPSTGLISLSGLLGGLTTGTVSYKSYIDTNNTPFGTEQLIGEVTGGGGGGGSLSGFAGTVDSSIAYTSPSPFSMTTQVTITHGGGGGFTSFNAIGAAVVPEPGVLGLMGLGLALLGIASLRQRRKLGA